MTNFKDLQNFIDAMAVEQRNFFRYEMPEIFEYAIKNLPKLKVFKLLRMTFCLTFVETEKVYLAVISGKSFTDAMQGINK